MTRALALRTVSECDTWGSMTDQLSAHRGGSTMTASSKFELLHKFITELTGDAGPFAHTDYLSFFENNHAEQMIFHQRKGEPVARLLHGDALLGPWKPIEITPEGLRRGKALTTIGGVILGDGEAQWLAACFRESESWRGGDEAQA